MLQKWNMPPGTLPNVTYFSTETRLTLNWFMVGAGIGFRVSGGSSGTQFGNTPLPGVQLFLVTGVMGAHFTFERLARRVGRGSCQCSDGTPPGRTTRHLVSSHSSKPREARLM